MSLKINNDHHAIKNVLEILLVLKSNVDTRIQTNQRPHFIGIEDNITNYKPEFAHS